MSNINKDIQEMYDQVMKTGGPSGVFTQGIVDEYNRLKKLTEAKELDNKKVNVQFIKSTGQSKK
jgi:hypothetical protein|tara:strand:+ start:331 stop:522 length:192 start_codon:yes stop_codon:yes gene_type:complete